MAFGQPSDAWPRIHRGHNSWRVIQKIPEATGESEDEIGFINVVPFRTRTDKAPSSKDLQRAWGKVALPQIQALQLRHCRAWKEGVGSHSAPKPGQGLRADFLFKRGIGDSYIRQESQEVLPIP